MNTEEQKADRKVGMCVTKNRRGEKNMLREGTQVSVKTREMGVTAQEIFMNASISLQNFPLYLVFSISAFLHYLVSIHKTSL